MNDKPENEKPFQTLRGFIEGEEPDEELYFAYSASLRISGHIPDLDRLTSDLGIEPTYTHRKGDRRSPSAPPKTQDMWLYTPPLPESEPLERHIDALWHCFRDRKQYLIKLKETVTVDVFLGYRTNCDHAGIEIPHTSLQLFTELEIPFGISIIVA